MKNTTLTHWNFADLRPCNSERRHAWVFYASHFFKDRNVPAEIAVREIKARLTRDPNPANEVEQTVQNVYFGGSTSPSPRWPERNMDLLLDVLAANPLTVAELQSRSPVQLGSDGPHTETVIRSLFPEDGLICCGTSKTSARTRTLAHWSIIGLSEQQFIVPSPMTAKQGTNKSGQPSHRCLNNTGPRRFLVVEFDFGSRDNQAAVLWHLSRFAPLALVVWSGSKSCHGWFFVAQQPEELVQQFFAHACRLGADPATWTRCQLVRMPDGLRRDYDDDTGKLVREARQTVLFFNPNFNR